MQIANQSAQQTGSRYITQMHLLVGVASAPGSAFESLSVCDVNLADLKRRALECPLDDSIRAKDFVAGAIQEVERLKHNRLDVGHVLIALIADRDGNCARLLRSIGANLDKLTEEVERRLPQPTFPLYQALSAFANDSRVHNLRELLDDAQQQIESAVRQADFESANVHLKQKDDLKRKLESLLENLWRESNP